MIEEDSKVQFRFNRKSTEVYYQGLPLTARAESKEHIYSLFFATLIVKIQTLVGISNYVTAKEFSIPKSLILYMHVLKLSFSTKEELHKF